MAFALLSNRHWNSKTAARLHAKNLGPFVFISDKSELTTTNLTSQDLKNFLFPIGRQLFHLKFLRPLRQLFFT